jgi:hypothetical protein
VVTPAVDVNEDKLERWEIKAEKAAGALKTAMSPDVRVLIRDGEDDPIDCQGPEVGKHTTSVQA